MLILQAAARDPRLIDPAALDHAVQQQKKQFNCRTAEDERQLRGFLDLQFRDMRIRQEMIADAKQPSAKEVEAFYNQHTGNFRIPTMFRAAHIVREVNELQSEAEARAGIEAAQAELVAGKPFRELAGRHSDCKGNGGDLGEFPAGFMVDDFEKAIDALQPGQRTGIFTTRFGFHIGQLDAKRPSRLPALQEVRGGVESALWMQRRHELHLQSVAKLRAEADIRFAPDTEEEHAR
jgi:peptidyl-prolyl cis-trans isomerase C